ncbi:hypothetical protein [Zymobacter sp. IVIA_5232.4 C2]|uniref:hypothetical protein n=1 Tax=Zymobacter sp. IVIA_5232.4 C2 TaxID=3394855 RepID=UPI0039C408C0
MNATALNTTQTQRFTMPTNLMVSGINLFEVACDYLIKQNRRIGRQALLARCVGHLEVSGASREEAAIAASQAFAHLAAFNSRNRIDVDASTSSMVMVRMDGCSELLALTVDDIVGMWKAQNGISVKHVAV